ncbi:hypothetical protein ACRAWB_12160 [Leifsonia poae]
MTRELDDLSDAELIERAREGDSPPTASSGSATGTPAAPWPPP